MNNLYSPSMICILIMGLLDPFHISFNSGNTHQTHKLDQQQSINKNVYIYRDSVVYKNYTLRIETSFLKDSVNVKEKHLFKPIIVKQRMLFLKDGKIVRVSQNTSKKIYQEDVAGHKVLMLSNVYSGAYIKVGRYKSAFVISGYGGCNSCDETLDFYTLKGKMAYNNSNGTISWKYFLKSYGISDKDYGRSDNEIIVYPPGK